MLCCALALPLSSGPALAQATPIELEQTAVVSTSVIEQNTIDRFASLSTRVGQEQIRDLNALDLSSALRRTPGVVVSRFNPVGSFGGAEGGAVYIRGLGASRPGSEIKTYIDGIPFYMGVWGHPLLDLLPINGMAAIDVYKGPQPQRFGNTFAAIDLTPKSAGAEDGQRGGRALLRKGAQGWRVVLCAGDSLLDARTLRSAGLNESEAERLSQATRSSEQGLPAERVRQFALFQGVVKAATDAAHGNH